MVSPKTRNRLLRRGTLEVTARVFPGKEGKGGKILPGFRPPDETNGTRRTHELALAACLDPIPRPF